MVERRRPLSAGDDLLSKQVNVKSHFLQLVKTYNWHYMNGMHGKIIVEVHAQYNTEALSCWSVMTLMIDCSFS